MEESEQKLKSKIVMDTSSNVSSSKRKSVVDGEKTNLSRMKVRKQSYGFSGISSVGGTTRRRSSQIVLEFKRPVLIYLPTFQLRPRVKFHVAEVTKAVNFILDAYYTKTVYTAAECPGRIMLIADKVMRTVKNMKFDRYRIISVVTMAEKRAQSYNNAVAFLWDHEVA